MNLDGRAQVSVCRPIAAPAAKIFQVLADPANHPALDGSGMLRAAPDQAVLSQVGDTFTMGMYLPAIGHYRMLNRVMAFDQDQRIAWEPTEVFDCTEAAQVVRNEVEDGQTWIPAMRQTLERLAALPEPTSSRAQRRYTGYRSGRLA